MRLIVEGKTYEEPDTFRLGEASDLCRISGCKTIPEWRELFQGGSPDALAAFIYVVKIRAGESVTEKEVMQLEYNVIDAEDETEPELDPTTRLSPPAPSNGSTSDKTHEISGAPA